MPSETEQKPGWFVSMGEENHWRWSAFNDLSGREVYDLLQLRCAVFVVEQACAYLDPDGLEFDAMHCSYREGGHLLACLRSLAPGVAYGDASAIGRIVVAPGARGRGLSRDMVHRGVAFNRERWPGHPVDMSAQAHLRKLYESLGFAVIGEPYLEDGIPHLHMRLDHRR